MWAMKGVMGDAPADQGKQLVWTQDYLKSPRQPEPYPYIEKKINHRTHQAPVSLLTNTGMCLSSLQVFKPTLSTSFVNALDSGW